MLLKTDHHKLTDLKQHKGSSDNTGHEKCSYLGLIRLKSRGLQAAFLLGALGKTVSLLFPAPRDCRLALSRGSLSLSTKPAILQSFNHSFLVSSPSDFLLLLSSSIFKNSCDYTGPPKPPPVLKSVNYQS